MKKETNPKAKRNGLWCNVLIVTALLLIVAVLMVVLRRNAPANVDANAPLLSLTATDAPTEAPTELATSTPEAAATPKSPRHRKRLPRRKSQTSPKSPPPPTCRR